MFSVSGHIFKHFCPSGLLAHCSLFIHLQKVVLITFNLITKSHFNVTIKIIISCRSDTLRLQLHNVWSYLREKSHYQFLLYIYVPLVWYTKKRNLCIKFYTDSTSLSSWLFLSWFLQIRNRSENRKDGKLRKILDPDESLDKMEGRTKGGQSRNGKKECQVME